MKLLLPLLMAAAAAAAAVQSLTPAQVSTRIAKALSTTEGKQDRCACASSIIRDSGVSVPIFQQFEANGTLVFDLADCRAASF